MSDIYEYVFAKPVWLDGYRISRLIASVSRYGPITVLQAWCPRDEPLPDTLAGKALTLPKYGYALRPVDLCERPSAVSHDTSR